MKKVLFTILALSLMNSVFADSIPAITKNDRILSLGTAFKNQQAKKLDHNDLIIVYGGEDLTRAATINPSAVA